MPKSKPASSAVELLNVKMSQKPIAKLASQKGYMRKIKVAVLFGGVSAENEVSLQSAKNVIEAIDRSKYDIIPIGIDKDGRWYLNSPAEYLLNSEDPKLIKLNKENSSAKSVSMVASGKSGELLNNTDRSTVGVVDVVFPILHGPMGEDGTIQGLFKLAGIPFVGSSVLGSAIGMDKDVMKRLFKEARIPTAKFISTKNKKIEFEEIKRQLGLPFFVKPANLGSSVGINKIHNKNEFQKAVEEAFAFDRKILFEEAIDGREIECSVLGNDNPIASIPGEVKVKDEFYSYRAKYIDENGAVLEIPAKISSKLTRRVQELAIKSFKICSCEGMARVDFFLRENDLIVNELNTIPGFTKISMYPKLWEASGLSYPDLIDKLIQLALERFDKEKKLKTSYFEK